LKRFNSRSGGNVNSNTGSNDGKMLKELKNMNSMFSKFFKLSKSGLGGGMGGAQGLGALLKSPQMLALLAGGALEVGGQELLGTSPTQVVSNPGQAVAGITSDALSAGPDGLFSRWEEQIVDGEQKFVNINTITGKIIESLNMSEASARGILDENGRLKIGYADQAGTVEKVTTAFQTIWGKLMGEIETQSQINDAQKKRLELLNTFNADFQTSRNTQFDSARGGAAVDDAFGSQGAAIKIAENAFSSGGIVADFSPNGLFGG